MKEQELGRQLAKWDGRRRRADTMLWLPRALLLGLMIALLLGVAGRFTPIINNQELAIISAGIILITVLIGFLVILTRRHSLDEQAHFVDRQFDLKERATTAVEISAELLSTTPELAQNQLSDTIRSLDSLDAESAMPLRFQWSELAILIMGLVLLSAAVLLPNPQAGVLSQRETVSAAIEDQVTALEILEQEIQQNENLSTEQQELLLEPLQSAMEELDSSSLSQEEAVAVLSEAEAEYRQLGEVNNSEALRQTLSEAGQALADNPAGQSLGLSLQNGDFGAASSEANQLADSILSMSDDEQAALANDLALTAQSLREVDPELAASLSQAAEALRDGNVSGAQQSLREAAAVLQERAQQQATAEQSIAAAEQMDQGREAVAQAGQPGQSDGLASGQETGENDENGDGQVGGFGDELGQSDGSELTQSPSSGQPGSGGGHVDNVFVPDFIDLSGDEGVDIELPVQCLANPESCGDLLSDLPTEIGDEQSLVPYDQVFGDYRDAAYQALDEDYIPLGLKGYIRDYFSSLEP